MTPPTTAAVMASKSRNTDVRIRIDIIHRRRLSFAPSTEETEPGSEPNCVFEGGGGRSLARIFCSCRGTKTLPSKSW